MNGAGCLYLSLRMREASFTKRSDAVSIAMCCCVGMATVLQFSSTIWSVSLFLLVVAPLFVKAGMRFFSCADLHTKYARNDT